MCSAPVTVSFVGAPTAQFSWTGNCRVDHVLVETPLPPSVGGFHPMWQIAATADGRGAASPLMYGVVPANMEELVAAEALQASVSYRVRIYVDDVAVGDLAFTYFPPD